MDLRSFIGALLLLWLTVDNELCCYHDWHNHSVENVGDLRRRDSSERLRRGGNDYHTQLEALIRAVGWLVWSASQAAWQAWLLGPGLIFVRIMEPGRCWHALNCVFDILSLAWNHCCSWVQCARSKASEGEGVFGHIRPSWCHFILLMVFLTAVRADVLSSHFTLPCLLKHQAVSHPTSPSTFHRNIQLQV